MPSAKQKPSNMKHGGGIRPNVWVLTFGPLCIIRMIFCLKIIVLFLGLFVNELVVDYK